jgi:hypothetical protein
VKTQKTSIDLALKTRHLDVEPILWLHRDPSGFVGFGRKRDPTLPPKLDKHGRPYAWEDLAMIQVEELRQMFPALLPYLVQDSYFTVHSFHHPAPWKNKTTGFRDVKRKETNALWLTACYADIDSGRPDSNDPEARMDYVQAIMKAEALMEYGVIPQASIMARSGQGIYLFWLLRDANDPKKLPHAWPEVIEAYKSINRAIQARCKAPGHLPVDLGAFDVARYLRTPGSWHGKAGRRVAYWIRGDDQGNGFTYTMRELAAALNLPAIGGDLPAQARLNARPSTYRKVKKPGSAPRRSAGAIKVNALRAEALRVIEQYRGGFLKRGDKYPDGHTSHGRRKHLELYANFLHRSRTDPGAALDSLRSMAANMRPAWPDEPGDPTPESIIEREYRARPRFWKDSTLCALLGVTADMARELDLRAILPDVVRLERYQARPLREDIITERREWLRDYLHAHPNPADGGRWSGRKVRDVLTPIAPHPFGNKETACQDLDAIGWRVRARPGRPPKAPDAPELPFTPGKKAKHATARRPGPALTVEVGGHIFRVE